MAGPRHATLFNLVNELSSRGPSCRIRRSFPINYKRPLSL
jgi:hypothetical protein